MPIPKETAQRSRRRVAALIGLAAAVVVAVVAAFTDCGTTDVAEPRALTADEADRLAIARFRNFEAGGRAVTITVPDPAGGLVITGSVDYRTQLGYGVVRGTGRNTSGDGLIEWSETTVFVHPMGETPTQAPTMPPTTGWHHRPLLTSGSTLDTALAIALGLGSDRPDNAQLLPQNGAAWIGQDQVNGHRVDVVLGPGARGRADAAGSVRYWLGQDGTMHRVRAAVASEPEPVVVDFDTHSRAAVPPVPGVAPPR
ncbi:hypothetical protein L6E12_00920 [Actinokineospora sp. PR83]|uniref:hypothetical protein n=1 Tax=Actinokineospora sp. PR83 TaxID=2884908 RepID=UPI001F350A57|nr:hypothetical protein [Actinokineospora sp. PR83]MCG8914358.1 hypothetical protein [Actinokineospora sp. PR83]